MELLSLQYLMHQLWCTVSELPLAEHRDSLCSRESLSGLEQKYRTAWQKIFTHSLYSPMLAVQAVTSPALTLPTKFLKALMSSFAQPLQPPHLCRSLGPDTALCGKAPCGWGMFGFNGGSFTPPKRHGNEK